jgi:hypothetical protein
MHKTFIFVVVCALVSPWLGGCVVWEIRDGIRESNTQLVQVKSTLDNVNTSLDNVNSRLDNVNARLDKVDVGLGRLDDTNLSLTDMKERLILLRSVEESLRNVDAHLASLRKTIGAIDSAIPFLDLGGDAPVEEPAPATAAAPDAGAEQIAAPGATPGAAAPDAVAGDAAKQPAAAEPAAPAKRDALIGTWVSAYPDESRALVLQQGNTFVMIDAASGKNPTRRSTGRWAREKNTLTLDGVQPPPQGKAPAQPQVQTWQILSLTARSVTIEGPDGIVVFAKP